MALNPTSHEGVPVCVARSSKHTCATNTDMISELPQNVAQHILEYLPLLDAVRMSILSSYWRYQWVLLPKLILDYSFLRFIRKCFETGSWSDHSAIYSTIISDILLRHTGPIDEFVLHVPSWFLKEEDIDRWIKFVTDKGIKQFTLVDNRDKKVRLPSCLFSCVDLTLLTLINCELPSLPQAFKGFTCLTSLQLHMTENSSVPAETERLEMLISNCLRLQSIILKIFASKSITIDAPEVRELVVDGKFSNIFLRGTTRLCTLVLNASRLQWKDIKQLLSCVPNIKKLVFENIFWPEGSQLCKSHPERLAHALGRLQSLELVQVPLNCLYAIEALVHLTRRSPQLELLHLTVIFCQHCCGETVQIMTSYSFPCLKHIKLVGILGLNNELELIKFLLACSPILEFLEIELSSVVTCQKKLLIVAKKLMQYRRASTKAEIIFKT